MGSQEIRSFLGGQRGDRCLYVSTGGFSKDAKYEADRSTIPITLIDLPTLRELLVENYVMSGERERAMLTAIEAVATSFVRSARSRPRPRPRACSPRVPARRHTSSTTWIEDYAFVEELLGEKKRYALASVGDRVVRRWSKNRAVRAAGLARERNDGA